MLSSYDPSFPLVIDPVIVVSTYAGSTRVTWGFCATYDDYGNIFTGGLSFGIGYPVTTGAFDVTFSGGVDIGISKMNPAGSALVYATYLGGGDKDYPHSLVVNQRDELCVFGSSSSTDYPVSTGCYDATYNGGASDIVAPCGAMNLTSAPSSTATLPNLIEGCGRRYFTISSPGEITSRTKHHIGRVRVVPQTHN